jgi:hypothetical protein
MTERERFAAEVLLGSWALLAALAVGAAFLLTELEQARDEIERLRAVVECGGEHG